MLKHDSRRVFAHYGQPKGCECSAETHLATSGAGMSCILSSAACFFSHSFGVATFRRRPSIAEISTWHQHNCSMAAYKGGICGYPGVLLMSSGQIQPA